MIDGARAFDLFGMQHWVATAITIGAAVALPLAVQRLAAEPQELARKALTVCLVVYLLGAPVIRAGVCDLPLREHLPLHLCGMSVLLGTLMLWRRSYRIYEVVYFWATAGTLAAVLTPDVAAGFPHPLFLLFFVGHGLGLRRGGGALRAALSAVCGPRRRDLSPSGIAPFVQPRRR